jgi:tRNA-2-methylthio-N6-dimethylallyladenosine synthase
MSKESKAYKNLPKKVYIRTFGCQMNVRDSEVICGLLKQEGYLITDQPNKADIVLFNTCSVRQHAEDKVWSKIGKIGKTPRPTKKIVGLVGCMAQNYKEEVFQRAPSVDFIVGPSDIDKIPAILSNLSEKWGRGQSPKSWDSPQFLYERKIWETDGEARPEKIYHTGFYEDKEHLYVVISEGCSNFCSYCVVPYVRGKLHNRNYQDIIREIEEAVGKGIAKITLLGQNVCAYGAETRSTFAGRPEKPATRENINFIKLLKLVEQIKGLKEFGFITSHPKDTTLELFEAMRDLDKLKKHLHLPVQSGSDNILERMNRGYTRQFYLELVGNYRKIVKGGVLSTDIIVGFPGESEADFQDTYNLVKEIQFDSAYIFKYSPRPRTEALKWPDALPKEEKERRHRIILELQKEISRNSNIKNQISK